MKMTEEMVDYVAALSQISVSAEEKEKAARDMGSIIEYMDVLNRLDTSGVEPMSHVFNLCNVFRPDEVMPSFDREELLKNAPARDHESFLVPQTVE